MACGTALLSAGYSVDICPSVTSGVFEQFIWFANFEDITAWTTSGNTDEYEAITFAAGSPSNGLYRIKLDKDGPIWVEEYDPEKKSWYHELSGKMPSLDLQARNFINSLNGPDIVAIVRLRAGEFKILGKDGGCKLFTHKGSSDGTEVGNQFSIRATNQPEPCAHFLDTDVTTTLTTLDGYEVTS